MSNAEQTSPVMAAAAAVDEIERAEDETTAAIAEAASRRAQNAARARASIPRYFLGTLAANAVHATLERVGEYRWGERATETSRLIEAALTRLLDDVDTVPPSGQERGFEPEIAAGKDSKLTAALDALKTGETAKAAD